MCDRILKGSILQNNGEWKPLKYFSPQQLEFRLTRSAQLR
jgi:hypothetical protein